MNKVGELLFLSGMLLLLVTGCGAKTTEDVIDQYSLTTPQDNQDMVEEDEEQIRADEEQRTDDMVDDLAEGSSDSTAEGYENGLLHKSDNGVTITGLEEQGQKTDSLYQQSVLLDYDFHMPELSLSKEEAAVQIGSWYVEEYDAFQYELAKRTSQADSDCLLRLAASEEEQRGWGIPGCYSVSYAAYENDNNVSFLKAEYYYYSGGAHGITTYTGKTFDRQTGKALTLDDFLKGQENGRLLLTEYFIEQLNGEELWESYGDTIAYKLVFNPQFYVDNDALIFLFDQYELASYAQGPFFLEVPVEVIENLESAVADKNAVKQMADRMKIPEAINRHMVEIPSGESAFMDLDGDGEKEEILYPTKASDEKSAVTMDTSVMINGKELVLTVDENIVEEFIAVVDIDSGDGKYELAVCAKGSSDDYVTAFFRYKNGKLQEIGRIGCLLDRKHLNSVNIYLTGDGVIYGERILLMLELRSVNARWELDGQTDRLVLYEKELYDFFLDDWMEPVATSEGRRENFYQLTGGILIYDEPDRTSARRILTEEDAVIIQFPATDGKNWVEAELLVEDEIRCGWLYVKDGYYIETSENEFTFCSDVINGLRGAG